MAAMSCNGVEAARIGLHVQVTMYRRKFENIYMANRNVEVAESKM